MTDTTTSGPSAPASSPDAATAPDAAEQAHVREVGHLVLYVSDLARSVEFYGGVLGWRQIVGEPGVPVAAFSGGRTHHELLLIEVGPGATPIPPGRRVGMYHFGLKVGDTDDELREVLDRLRSRPDLVTMVGASDHVVTHSLYVQDPDGNEVELYVDVPGVDWRSDPSLIAAPVRPLRL
ncbi:VOC family protein [Dermatobacter hominis]|uniref:VOC family protein n=1 Tax=Dermatobacter hominis TaxID=2884263 RepID=UPI001D1087B5|nr:VOC family protein [Dermatobacter hominis]UDY35918.1 VOC family protein [Dermatobacter hominis]